MAKIVVVTSGKGGVGKTTTSASFSSGLALAGKKTAVIDFDVGLRNLDLIMGCERRVVYDLINVIQGEANLNQALIKDKQCDNLFVLAASQTRDKEALTQEGVEKVPQGPGRDGFRLHRVRFAGRHRDRRADGDALCRRGADRDQSRGLVGARLRPHPRHARLQDAARQGRRRADQGAPAGSRATNPNRVADGQMLVAGGHPGHPAHQAAWRDTRVRERADGLDQGVPAIHDEETEVAQAYRDVVARFLGEERPMRFIDAHKPGFFKRLFGGR